MIARCVFATKINANHNFVKSIKNIQEYRNLNFLLLSILPHFIAKHFNKSNIRDSISFYVDIVKRAIKMRKESNEKYDDFLGILLESLKESVDPITEDEVTSESHHFSKSISFLYLD